MAKIENREDFEKWLAERPATDRAGIAVALAARVTFRVLPLVATAARSARDGGAEPFIQSTAAVFRGAALAWAAAKFTNRVVGIRDTSSAPSASFAASARSATVAAAAAARAAAAYVDASSDGRSAFAFAARAEAARSAAACADAAARSAAASIDVATFASAFVHTASSSARSAAGAAAAAARSTAVWKSIERDAGHIENGARLSQLFDLKLWEENEPNWAKLHMLQLAMALPNDHDWGNWFRWYDERVQGHASDEARDIIFASAPVELWDKGPQHANAWIAERLAELDAPEQPPEPPVIETSPPPIEHRAVRFGLSKGRLHTVPSRSPDAVSASETVDMRAALAAARKLFDNIADRQVPHIASAVLNLINLFESGQWLEPDLLRQACRPILSKATVYVHPEAKWELLPEHVDKLVELSFVLRDLQRSVSPVIVEHEREVAAITLSNDEIVESAQRNDDLADVLDALSAIVADDVVGAFETGRVAYDAAETAEDRKAVAVERIFVAENLVIAMARDLPDGEVAPSPEQQAIADAAAPTLRRARKRKVDPAKPATSVFSWDEFAAKCKKRFADKAPDKLTDQVIKLCERGIARAPRTAAELAAVVFALMAGGPASAGGAVGALWLGHKLERIFQNLND